MLALYEADLAGASTSEKTWRLALDHWLAEQKKDGSWSYIPGIAGSGTMTCAGVACVSAAWRRVKDKAEAAQTAVKRGEQWLARHFTAAQNPWAMPTETKLWHFCYLYDMECAARLAKWSKIGDHDWRQEGIRMLLKKQDEDDGSWRGGGLAETDPAIATSLALLFLRPEPPEKPWVKDKQ